MRILIVDDDQAILKGLSAIIKKIEQLKCDIFTAYDGYEALDRLSNVGVDLVITDISMPGMSGLDMIREARLRKVCNRFIILTGYEEFEYARQAIHYQVCDYLLKPINKEGLIDIILRIDMEMKETDKKIKEVKLPDINICLPNIDRNKCSNTLEKILDFIDENYQHDLSLERLSEVFSLHPNYICNLFSRELNLTYLFYIDSIRIKKSMELLIYNNDILKKDIAVMVGFLNERQFYKVFKKRIGMTPGEFRKSNHDISFGQ